VILLTDPMNGNHPIHIGAQVGGLAFVLHYRFLSVRDDV
jgi:hypothetical protein